MASLQDQLLKAGLADQNTARKINKNKHKQAKATHKIRQQAVDKTRLSTEQKQRKHAERDRQLNRQKQDKANKNAIMAQIVQLIEINKVDRNQGEIPYHFIHQKKVKNIHVTEALQTQLSLGRLAIVYFEKNRKNRYELVPAGIAEKIAQRDQHCVVQMNQQQHIKTDADDPYATYQIPDDLMW